MNYRKKQISEQLAAETDRRADCEFAAKQALIKSGIVNDNAAAQIIGMIANGLIPYVRFDYSMPGE